MVTLHAGVQIRTLLGFVRERVRFGVIFDLEIGSVFLSAPTSKSVTQFPNASWIHRSRAGCGEIVRSEWSSR
jgi:hypothetical protein